MNPILHTRQQLDIAEDLLNRKQIDECFAVCNEIQGQIEKLVAAKSSTKKVSEINSRYSVIIRMLNRIMAQNIKERT